MPESMSGPSELLQSTMRKYLNREIREWFSDVDLDQLDINTPRGALVQSCRHDDDDSFLMTLGRTMLFDSLVRQRFQAALLGGGDGIGETSYRTDVRRANRPLLKLFFMEDLNDVAEDYAPVAGRISVRLMDHDESTITPEIARTYAQRVKSSFSAGNGFIWRKGKEMCSYSDWRKGYQLQLLVRTRAEGKRIVEQVLDLQNHTPDWEFFEHKVNDAPLVAYPTIPGQDRIYGETRRPPRKRPIADVRFQYASLHISGLHSPVTLVDRTGVIPLPLVS